MHRGSNLISVRSLYNILADLRLVPKSGQSAPSSILTSTSPSSSSSPFFLFDATVGGADAFRSRRIPGALFFDLKACADVTSGLTRTAPLADVFEDYLQSLIGGRKWKEEENDNASASNQGVIDIINNNDINNNSNGSSVVGKVDDDGHLGPFIDASTQIVTYDCSPGFGGFRSAPRLWWLFKLFGHDQVSVLDGGFDAWLKCRGGRGGHAEAAEPPLEDGQVFRTFPSVAAYRKIFEAEENRRLIKTYGHMISEVAVVHRRDAIIVDARSNADFKESHVLTAVNYPFKLIVDGQTEILKPTKELVEDFADLGIHFDGRKAPKTAALEGTSAGSTTTASTTPFIVYCQTGTTACSVMLAASVAAEEIGAELNGAAIYDGSWEEWKKKKGPMDGKKVKEEEEKPKEEASEAVASKEGERK